MTWLQGHLPSYVWMELQLWANASVWWMSWGPPRYAQEKLVVVHLERNGNTTKPCAKSDFFRKSPDLQCLVHSKCKYS